MHILPNLRHLRFLVALEESLHFGRAAQACFVTQSTLSAGIKELELQLGSPVAERSKRHVILTPTGHRVAARGRLLLKEAEEIMAIGHEFASPMSGRIEIGILPTIGPFLLSRLVPFVTKKYPELKLSLREDKTGALLSRLKEGRLDLVLMAFPYAAVGLETLTLFSDSYRFVCNTDHPLARHEVIRQADLIDQSIMLLEPDNCLHSHALPVLEDLPDIAQASFSSTSLHTLVAMVSCGMGSTFLPDLALNAGILKGSNTVVRPLENTASARSICLAWRKHSARASVYQHLGEIIKNWAVDNCRPWCP